MRTTVLLPAIAGLAAASPFIPGTVESKVAQAGTDCYPLNQLLTCQFRDKLGHEYQADCGFSDEACVPRDGLRGLMASLGGLGIDTTNGCVSGDKMGQFLVQHGHPSVQKGQSSIQKGQSQVVKRQSDDEVCQPVYGGFGPVYEPDTPENFHKDQRYNDIADKAPVPAGTTLAFSNLENAVDGDGFMGYFILPSYDSILCKRLCDSETGCQAFNLYIERDPSVEPDPEQCPNPPSISVFKCALWGYPLSPKDADDPGQWRGSEFHVEVTASNGYNVQPAGPPTIEGFADPVTFDAAINAPSRDFIGSRFFLGPYDPRQCAYVCVATTGYDKKYLRGYEGTYDACNFFNSWALSDAKVYQGTVCAMYKSVWNSTYATNTGEVDRDTGRLITVSNSYGYALNPQDPGMIRYGSWNWTTSSAALPRPTKVL